MGQWSSTVVPATVHGSPTLVFEQRPRSVGAILREGRRWHDRELIVYGDRRLTFGDHEAAVHRAAALLASRGVQEGDRVAIFAANSPEWCITFFAILELGAIAVLCNGWWSESEVAHAIELTAPVLVVSDERGAKRLPPSASVLAIDDVQRAPETTVDLAVPDDEDRAAVILFTSGTTGFPKGATLSHRAIVANIQSLSVVTGRLPQTLADDHPVSVTFTSLPLFHIGALQLLLLPFVTGAKIVFLAGKFDAGEVLRIIEEEQVQVWSGVPTMVERVLVHPDLAVRDVSSVRTIVMGGSAVSPQLLERVTDAFPNAKRGVGQSYGLSEAGGLISTGVAAHMASHPGSVGHIVPVVEVRINEPDEHGIGEIMSRGPAVMDGYWALPDDPILTPDRWLHTGDLGWVDDEGFLYVTGRKKDMIIRGGENIAAAHIEATLKDHPAVREAAVVGLPHQELGEEVGAIIVVTPGETATPEELAAFVRQRLAHFEVPSQWLLRDDDLPKNDSGKVLKYQLRDEWAAQLDTAS